MVDERYSSRPDHIQAPSVNNDDLNPAEFMLKKVPGRLDLLLFIHTLSCFNISVPFFAFYCVPFAHRSALNVLDYIVSEKDLDQLTKFTSGSTRPAISAPAQFEAAILNKIPSYYCERSVNTVYTYRNPSAVSLFIINH